MTTSRFNTRDATARGTGSGVAGLAKQTGAMDLGPPGNRTSLEAGTAQVFERRPSNTSVHSMHSTGTNHSSSTQQLRERELGQSPASVSSSGTLPWMTPREAFNQSPQLTTSALPILPGAPGAGSSSMPRPSSHTQLPRIARPPSIDGFNDSNSPRSAPSSASPLSQGPQHGLPFMQAPPRSTSSPDPRSGADLHGSSRSSPVTSPRPAGSVPPYGHMPGAQTSFAVPPPRVSSFTNAAALATGPGSAAGSDGGITPRRSDTPTSTTSTHPPQGPPGPGAVQNYQPAQQQTAKRSGSVTYCAKCGQAVRGQFVRALHQVYHLDCFRCRDCDKVVAQKFFPVEDNEGRQYPLCERDYFARLDLICAKCDQALRSSYITACGEKFHVEHFTCSVCDTVFGASDSYYEHDGKVYCHYHYSISFANKCVGCETAILKQFVEINRNGRDECWHPECYMIHKFWNVRLASRNFTTPASATPASSSLSLLEMSSMPGAMPGMSPQSSLSANASPGWDAEMSAKDLKERQVAMELKVSQIWLVLSGFEESSAACIGDMLRVVNERKLLDVILLAEKFILHVETLFAVIDDLEAQFALAGVKGMSHAREAKQLCRKLVNFFSMLSQISPHATTIPNMQELLTQVTQLAHYLKILIRIALTGAIKLDREQNNPKAMTNALARLHLLSLDNAEPSLRKRGEHPDPPPPSDEWNGNESAEEMAKRSYDLLSRHPEGFIPSTRDIAYGYRSLASEVTSETTIRGPQPDAFVPNDGCITCNGAIEDDCVRLGMFSRWHSMCVECGKCHDKAGLHHEQESPSNRTVELGSGESTAHDYMVKAPTRKLPPRAKEFFFEPPKQKYGAIDIIWCVNHRTATAEGGFESVSRLEQFAFLLHVALRRLYLHFREHHKIPSALTRSDANTDVKRVKSVTLDRKLSSTARLPQRSTVVESPAGKMADENGQVVPARSTTSGTAPPATIEEGGSSESGVDVLRPAFARNNTQIRIIKDEPPVKDSGSNELSNMMLAVPQAHGKEDDALTLSDIPLLANRQNQPRSALDNVPLFAQLPSLDASIARHFALINLTKTGLGHLIDVEDILELLDTRKNQWWIKIFKNNGKKDQKKKGIFGVPIEVLVHRTGSDSQQGASSTTTLRVPEFIEDIVSTMRQQDMAVEGIFRKNGNIRRLQDISEQLDKDSSIVTLSEENPVQLAALLKRFLREMPEPLLTFKLHKLFCAAATLPNPEDRKRCLHLLVTLLPKPNRDTLEVLFVFLRWVASFSYRDEETGSRMDIANLATVITPSILYAKSGNPAREDSMVAISAVQQLLENQDDIYHIPLELMFVIREKVGPLFANYSDLTPKEMHKYLHNYLLKRNASHPGAHPGQPPQRQGPHGGVGGGGPHMVRGDSSQNQPQVQGGQQQQQQQGGQGRPDLRLSALPPPHPVDGSASGSLRAPQSNTNSRPTSWGAVAPPPGPGTPGSTIAPPALNGQSAAQGQPFGPPGGGGGPQQTTPTMSMPIPAPAFRGGPFQGAERNGSRQSSRGSAPSSPGLPEDRRSVHMERDRSRERAWTPSEGHHPPATQQAGHPQQSQHGHAQMSQQGHQQLSQHGHGAAQLSQQSHGR